MHRLLALYLPSQHTDLALASLVEQWGLIAGAIAVLAAVIVVWRVALASRVARTRRGTLVGAGLAALFGIETVVAVGGNLGVLPLAGVPFPLVSLGGTSAAVHLAALGLVLGARRDGVHRRLWAPPRWLNPRPRLARFIAFGTSGALVAFSVYGWQLQAAQGVSLRHTGQVQMSRCIRLPAARGVITDRHGETLAVTVDQDNIEAVPALLLRQPDRLARLASLIPLPISQLRQILTGAGNSLTVRVAEVPASVGSGIAAARFPDVFVVPSPKRIYPHGALLAPLLGFVGIATPQDAQRWPNLPLGEFVGRSGIEQEYDPLVRGVDGQQCMYVDPAGAPVTLGQRQDPVPGANLRLSIDIGLQQELTDDLAAALRGDFGGPRGDLGGAVAVDPQTGQVLAMASLPSYDDNLYGPPIDKAALDQAAKAPGNPMLEHATQSVAPPGSTFKIVVAATDVVYPVIPPAEVIPTGGSFTLADHTYNNWGVLGPMSLVPSIAWSNDVYFYKLAWALGPNRISQIGTALGVGQPTGIDLPGENPGYLGNPQSVANRGGTWYAGSTVILGIGQGYINVTPLQNARWTAALATGSLVTPHLGLGFSAGGGSFIGLPAPAPAPLPFAAALGPIREGMRGAVSYGTAAILSNLPVPAGAKTGSAEDPTNPNGVTDSWLTAAAPIDNPAVVVTSLVRAGGHGATTSGPVVDQAMQYFFAHQAQILAGPPTPQG
jgi:cell division protein FtsI/penicillin-binding protein 2